MHASLRLSFGTLLLIHAIYSKTCFPKDFKFGAATSAYQIEGGWNEDGKGPNFPDYLIHNFPEVIVDGSNGDVACDSYHNWPADVLMLKHLGVQFYRFSLAWSRILPNGRTDKINHAGISYYNSIITVLKVLNIEPVVTMNHFDIPEALNDIGGWLNPNIPQYFAEYADLCFKSFGWGVKTWLTINEPIALCSSKIGGWGPWNATYVNGVGTYKCSYHVLLAHAKAYHVYVKKYRAMQKGRLSLVLDGAYSEPYNASNPLDQEAAERDFLFTHGRFCHPLYIGNWPQVMIDRIGNRSQLEGYPRSRLPEFTPEEIEFIKGTNDFFSFNQYVSQYITTAEEAPANATPSVFTDKAVEAIPNANVGLRKQIKAIHDYYAPKEYAITENGYGDPTGELIDDARIDYLKANIKAVLDSILIDKMNVSRYTVWSLMDNFEWFSGYTNRFGIYHVDFNSTHRIRTPKKSAGWYRNLIKNPCLD